MRAIAHKLQCNNGIHVDPDRQIIVTVGTNEAILLAMLATLNPGDEVLIPDPSWLHYFYCARLARARPVSVPLREENEFQLDPHDLERLTSPRTRMLVLNSPHNPTGARFSPATLQAVARFVEQRGLLLVSEEIYEKLVYGQQPAAGDRPAVSDQPHTSPGAIPAIAERTITINGFSKAYAMTGWRVGFALGAKNLLSNMLKLQSHSTSNPTSFAQAGAVEALSGSQDSVATMRKEFERRRNVIVEGLRAIPKVRCGLPQGAFYVYPNVSAYLKKNGLSDVQELAEKLLEEVHVALVPGPAFGTDDHVRISYATSQKLIDEGLRPMSAFFARQ